MTHHFGRIGVHWQRTILLLIIFICTLFIIYQTDTSDDNDDRKSEFYEDFGNEKSEEKETLFGEKDSKEKIPDQLVEVEKEPHQAPVAVMPGIADHQSADPAQQQQIEHEQSSEHSPAKQETPPEPSGSTEGTALVDATSSPQQNSIETPESMSKARDDPTMSSAPHAEPSPATIPRIIHQSAPSEILPTAYQALIDSCLKQNADWQYYMWRNRDRDEFLQIRYPQHVDWFNKVASKQQQEHMFRFFVLQVYGGIYLDIDMECVKPMESLPSNSSIFVGAERSELAKIVRNVDRSADITVVAGTPGHELFNRIFEQLASLPYEPIDVSAMLTSTFDAFSESVSVTAAMRCTLGDYHYFGSALDASFPWNMTCMDLLQAYDNQSRTSVESAALEQQLKNRQQGCIELREKQWNLMDLNSDTLAVHRYLNASLIDSGENTFNLTQLFPNRVTYYCGGAS